VSEGFVLCNVLARAPGLVVEFGIVAGGAGVPDGDVVAAQEAVVVIVEVFVVVGWRGVAVGGWCGSGSGYGRDDWCRHGRDARRKMKRTPMAGSWGGRCVCPWLQFLPVLVVAAALGAI